MNAFGLTFHHLGLAVRNPDQARSFLAGLGYVPTDAIHDPEQNVNLFMCSHQLMPEIEVIYPASEKGPVSGIVNRHTNGIVYHVCYTTEDLQATLLQMERSNIRAVCVSRPKPAVLFDQRRVSFYMVDGIGLIEIIEASSAT